MVHNNYIRTFSNTEKKNTNQKKKKPQEEKIAHRFRMKREKKRQTDQQYGK